jgi:hypothetical protein
MQPEPDVSINEQLAQALERIHVRAESAERTKSRDTGDWFDDMVLIRQIATSAIAALRAQPAPDEPLTSGSTEVSAPGAALRVHQIHLTDAGRQVLSVDEPAAGQWRMVPVELTRDMRMSIRVNLNYGACTPEQVWAAALAAAPHPPRRAQAEAVAWMDPATLDVIHAERKRAWETNFGQGGKAKAATYTVPLAAGQAQRGAGEGLVPLSDERIAEILRMVDHIAHMAQIDHGDAVADYRGRLREKLAALGIRPAGSEGASNG